MIIIPHYREKHCFPAEVNALLMSLDQTSLLTNMLQQSILLKHTYSSGSCVIRWHVQLLHRRYICHISDTTASICSLLSAMK